MPAAVNCLVNEPMRKTVFAFTGAASSRLARPYPFANTSLPSRRTATAAPATRPEETSCSRGGVDLRFDCRIEQRRSRVGNSGKRKCGDTSREQPSKQTQLLQPQSRRVGQPAWSSKLQVGHGRKTIAGTCHR